MMAPLFSGVVDAWGLALLHFVWQATALAAALGLVLGLLPRRAARARYAAGCLTLALMLAAPLFTTWTILTSPEPDAWSQASLLTASAARPGGWAGLAPGLLSWTVAAWTLGVLFFSIRLAGGWWHIRRLVGTAAPAADTWLETVARLRQRMPVARPVRLLQSARVQVPVVVGWLRPVLLLPVSALSGLSPRQIEAVLAHELAHVRRHDYLVNLLQASVEAMLFYHPAVWWVSKTVRVEREHCCDDLAVGACGDVALYARALTEIEVLRDEGYGVAMAVTGGSPLVERVRRLVGADRPRRLASSGGTVAALTVMLVAGAGATHWLHLPQAIDGGLGATAAVLPFATEWPEAEPPLAATTSAQPAPKTPAPSAKAAQAPAAKPVQTPKPAPAPAPAPTATRRETDRDREEIEQLEREIERLAKELKTRVEEVVKKHEPEIERHAEALAEKLAALAKDHAAIEGDELKELTDKARELAERHSAEAIRLHRQHSAQAVAEAREMARKMSRQSFDVQRLTIEIERATAEAIRDAMREVHRELRKHRSSGGTGVASEAPPAPDAPPPAPPAPAAPPAPPVKPAPPR